VVSQEKKRQQIPCLAHVAKKQNLQLIDILTEKLPGTKQKQGCCL